MALFGLKTPTQHSSWETMREVWREADQLEIFDSAWTWDHLYPLRGDPHGTSLDGWMTLSALAGETSRLRLGTMVTGMHFRPPAVTAKMAATLDHISGGRLLLGLGAGWFEAEAEANGIELGTIRERMDRFDEGLEVILSLLTEEETTFQGDFYRLEAARSEPKPMQRPHPPIVIGGTGKARTLRAVARHAQVWDGLRAEGDEWAELRDILHMHCEEVGRDPAEITCSVHVSYGKGVDPARVADKAAQRLGEGVDMVVFSMTSPYDASMAAPLARALEEVS